MLRVLGRATSGNVQKVLWCCGELGLDFERSDIGGPFGGTDGPDYLALNPNGLIPTIVDDGLVLWESNAIIRYLCAAHGHGELWPADHALRARADRWMDWQLSFAAPAYYPLLVQLLRTAPADRDRAVIAAARTRFAAAMAILDAALADSAYVAGPRLTMGDIPLGMAVHRWFGLAIEREDYRHLARWYEALCRRPAFRTHAMVEIH